MFDADQRPVLEVNEWLRTLSTSSDAPTTWLTYAREIVKFATFLRLNYDVGLLDEAIARDGDAFLDSYRQTLTRPDEVDSSLRPVGDARSTLGKRRAAIVHFYTWAVRRKYLREFPFELTPVRTRYGQVQTLARLRGGRRTRAERTPIPSGQIDRFFSVGILGRTPTGEPDESFLRYRTANRTAAGFALGVAAGLRHSEVLATTIFEIPRPHADGLTPVAVADQITKGDWGRRAIGFSHWLRVCWQYIDGDRRTISRSATWQPTSDPWLIDITRTNGARVTFTRGGTTSTERWRDLDLANRLKLVIPGQGSPLLLLNHHARDGRPVTDEDSLNDALNLAGERCAAHWPDEDWDFSMHHLRHTYGTELSRFVGNRKDHIAQFETDQGRKPVWSDLMLRESPTLIVQESMGHSSPETTKVYTHTALWDLLLSVNGDPQHNPAVRSNA